MTGWTICFRNGGERMSKRTIAPIERLRRHGNFWEEGMELTQADRELLHPLIERAKELGYTPPREQVFENLNTPQELEAYRKREV